MYRTWLSYYEPTSWGIVFDFDTFFQRGPLHSRIDPPRPRTCIYSRRIAKSKGGQLHIQQWLRCWGKETPKKFANNSVVCSGSTMGSVPALKDIRSAWSQKWTR